MQRKHIVYSILLVLLCVFMFVLSAQADYDRYVDGENGSNSNGGTSWGDAWKTITHALYATRYMGENGNPVVIHVADYTYDQSGETFPLQPTDHHYIVGESEEWTVIVSNGSSSVFRFASVADVKLEKLTLRGGSARKGGGIYCSWSNVEIIECTVEYNEATGAQQDDHEGSGGGMYFYQSSPVIRDCHVYDNTATPSVGWGGGGMFFEYNSHGTITNCDIRRNAARRGAAILCDEGSSPSVTDCDMVDNHAEKFGGGLWCYEGSSPRLENCTIDNNTAKECGGGVGIHNSSSPTFVNCRINGNTLADGKNFYGAGVRIGLESRPIFTGCEIIGNTGAKFGGGIYIAGSDTKPTIMNTTIQLNTAKQDANSHGGGIYCDSGSPVISKCTIGGADGKGNEATSTGGGIECRGASAAPVIADCEISYNVALHGGGICSAYSAKPQITSCKFMHNQCGRSGAGLRIHLAPEDTKIEHCIIAFNIANGEQGENYGGAGMSIWQSDLALFNCLIFGNELHNSVGISGGISCEAGSSPAVTNCTIADNVGHGVYVDDDTGAPTLENCILWGNDDDLYGVDCDNVLCCDIEDGDCRDDGNPNHNMCDDPIFVSADDPDDYEDYFLSEDEIEGQNEDSPCIDAGKENASHYGLHIYTTRTDGEYDPPETKVDMGYHYVSEKSIYYVNAEIGNNEWDGRSRTYEGDTTGPWKTITHALSETGDEEYSENDPLTIYVAAGTYDPTMGGGDHESFPLVLKTYTTLIGEGGFGSTIIDADNPSNAPVIKVDGVHYVTIKGFTITGGNNSEEGGGLDCRLASPMTIDGCLITENTSHNGGGIYFDQCGADAGYEPRIQGCRIENNKAEKTAPMEGFGGGVYCANYCDISFFRCIFVQNEARNGGSGGAVAIYLEDDMDGEEPDFGMHDTKFEDCTFQRNWSSMDGGGLHFGKYSRPIVFNSIIIDNKAEDDGGGVHCEVKSGFRSMYLTIQSNRAERNGGGVAAIGGGTNEDCSPQLGGFTIIEGNSAREAGGGIYCERCTWDATGDDPETLARCCLIVKNTVDDEAGETVGGGIHLNDNSDGKVLLCTIEGNWPTGISAGLFSEPIITNSILWNNNDDLYNVSCSQLSHCDIDNDDEECAGDENGNISADPLFVPLNYEENPDYVGYYLAHEGTQARNSPCIDAGDDASDAYGMHAFTTCTDGSRQDEGTVDMGYHHREGYKGDWNTYIELASFEASARGNNIFITWETATEINNAGFDLYRIEHGDRTTRVKINDRLIPAQGSPAVGASYEFLDTDVTPGVSYNYYLVDIDTSGKETTHGPASARVPDRPILTPLDRPTSPFLDRRQDALRLTMRLPGFEPVL